MAPPPTAPHLETAIITSPPAFVRLLPLAILASATLTACQLPGMPGGKVAASPSPAATGCSGTVNTGPVASGIANPGPYKPIHVWTSRLPDGWTQTNESTLKSGFSLRANGNDSNDKNKTSFLNVTRGAEGIDGTDTAAELVSKEVVSAKKDGYTVDPAEEHCKVDGTEAISVLESKTDTHGKLYIYEVIFVYHGTDSLFGKPSTTPYSIIGGAYDSKKDQMIKDIKGLVAGWKWLAPLADSAASPGPGAATSSVRLKGAFEVRGAVSASGTYDESVTVGATGCSALAAQGDKQPKNDLDIWPLPPTTDTSIGGHTVHFAGLLYYKTSGTFQIDGSVKGQSPTLNAVALKIDGVQYGIDTATRATATIKDGASGSLTFTGLKDFKSGGVVSGSTTWTCSDS